MFSFLSKSYFITILFLLIISILFCFFVPIVDPNCTLTLNNLNSISFSISSKSMPWPTPGYTVITSPFGRRNAPTEGASSFHSGIDIGAPTGCNIIAICSGTVTFLGFSGAGGFTITIEKEGFSVSYCHVSPEFQVYIGQKIKQGQVIGKVGPEFVYDVPDNPYTDENGNPTNGATTGPHLHLTLRKNNELVNPLDYLS